MTRRTQTLVYGLLVMFAAVVLASVVPVPLVALGPGPTFDTLGEVEGRTVVAVNGRPAYPTTGHLNMTTVAVTDDLTAMYALRFWLDRDYEVVPRATIYPPEKTHEQVEQENNQLFSDSETDAEVAALAFLREPVKVLVGDVVANAPAGGVLRAGDQLLTVNNVKVTSPVQVTELMRATKPGDVVHLSYLRGDAEVRQGTVTAGVRPGGPQGFLGITPQGEPFDPNQVVISLGKIGGPSAGLPFALAVVDKLTPGDLLGGRFVAGTGAINQYGDVAKIGGIPLKMLAARNAGATVFLVPAENCEEARGATPDGLQLVKVANLSDAVNAMNELKAGKPAPGC
ncbi:PDZ domain-containing protein [Pseudonocardia eucalypti]|uniref:PDZ domain-containing protein n=1 Tax=Pseudonocardia eucalypti TaxID=648755 RepID=A0ABP9QC64_9PSEU|nr:PDZ domain-containing protein [Pseudonocardia eucalypti]